MYIPNKGVKKTVTLIPYTYTISMIAALHSGYGKIGDSLTVWVDKDNKHPDPSRKMIWGWDTKHRLISDFKEMFERKGKEIKIKYSVEGCWTAHEEDERKEAAIGKWIMKHRK